jgi:hypothetical protein
LGAVSTAVVAVEPREAVSKNPLAEVSKMLAPMLTVQADEGEVAVTLTVMSLQTCSVFG